MAEPQSVGHRLLARNLSLDADDVGKAMHHGEWGGVHSKCGNFRNARHFGLTYTSSKYADVCMASVLPHGMGSASVVVKASPPSHDVEVPYFYHTHLT